MDESYKKQDALLRAFGGEATKCFKVSQANRGGDCARDYFRDAIEPGEKETGRGLDNV